MAEPEILEIRFDAQGDIDRAGEAALHDALDQSAPTDLMIFSHGWNNSPATARSLYKAFFQCLADVHASHGRPGRKVAYLGVFWPSIRWSDEPIPDFSPGEVVDLGAGAGPAVGLAPRPRFDPPPPPDAELQSMITAAFPSEVTDKVKELLVLIERRPDNATDLDRARELVREIAVSSAPDSDERPTQADDGAEQVRLTPLAAEPDPSKNKLFRDFTATLEQLNVDTGSTGGAAGLGDFVGRLWHGAQEVLRGMTYWQMKNRAGVVGQTGLGPLIGRLRAQHPNMTINLIGHSFGARVVAYALKGLAVPAGAQPPVQSVTLLQGAFSHFVFANKVRVVDGRSGALAGQQAKVVGPVTACFSKFDSAVGVLYPLASMAKGDALAGVDDVSFRFGGIGFDGHQEGVTTFRLLPNGRRYDFKGEKLINVDARRLVRNGKPPSGAHSDIIYDDLAWVVVCAADLAQPN